MVPVTHGSAPAARSRSIGVIEDVRSDAQGGSQETHGCPQELRLPGWVTTRLGGSQTEVVAREERRYVAVKRGAHYSLVTVRVAGAALLEPLALQRQTTEAYRRIAGVLRESSTCHPVRFWNFVPRIGSVAAERMDRYMVFNAGRFAAYLEWYGNVEAFDRCVATATGIGHDVDDLVIHVLASDRPGMHIMNPRQHPPRCYSRRYGPFPPCFARATLLAPDAATGTQLLIGGTAAVFGERSLYHEDLRCQTEETFRNLAELIETAESKAAGGNVRNRSTADPLNRFDSLRVYFRRMADEAALREMVEARFPHICGVEFLRADICRPELLVEIEGTVELVGDSR